MITTSTGNTASDILNQTGLKPEAMDLFTCESSPLSLAKELRRVTRMGAYQLVVMFRGGNEDTNMMIYSNEKVLDEVIASPIPVATAIGHEADRPIVQEVADISFASPSSFAKEIAARNIKFIRELDRTFSSIGKNGVALFRQVFRSNDAASKRTKSEVLMLLQKSADNTLSLRDSIKADAFYVLHQSESCTTNLQSSINASVDALMASRKAKKQNRMMAAAAIVIVILIGVVITLSIPQNR